MQEGDELEAHETGVQMVDISAPEVVEVLIRRDGKVVWVNVDGQCLFRACKVGTVIVNDESAKPQVHSVVSNGKHTKFSNA